MPVVSVTRLHLRVRRSLLPFLWRVWSISRQARCAPGFLDGQVANEKGRGFWTLTVWDGEASMRSFRDAGAHVRAMRKLLEWCDEASFVHWEEPGVVMPSVEEAHQRLRQFGRVSKLHHPSAAHLKGQTTGSEPPRPGLRLRARQPT
jgi:hypothetical protein